MLWNTIKTLNKSVQEQTRFTPDIATLELSQFHLLFVCDDLMRAGENYKLIADSSASVARGFTRNGYNFYRRAIYNPITKKTDETAVVVAAKQTDSRYDFSCLKIKGEIHCIESKAFIKLDTHYQNGVQFRRKRVQILYPTRQHGQIKDVDVDGKPLPEVLCGNNHNKHFLLPERVDPIWCWMYIGASNYWKPLLDGGFAFEPVRIVEPKEDKNWLVKYYHWQNQP